MVVSAGRRRWGATTVTEPASGQTRTIGKIVFSSDELPAEFDDRARFSLWQDLYAARYGSLAFSRPTDLPFSVRLEFTPFGGVGLGHFAGTIEHVARTADAVAADGTDDFCLFANRGRSPMLALQHGRETTLAPGAAALFTDTEVGGMRGTAENAWHALVVPRRPLLDLINHAEDAIATAMDPTLPAMRYLSRYLTMLLAPEWPGDDPVLGDHVGSTLIDLLGLALGAGRDAAEIARGRGLRAARLSEIVAAIRAGYADPAFSPRSIALNLGLTPRYVQELLSETGRSFTDRVLELRLQKARAMLANPRYDRLRVSEIAYASGFNDISYFNRSFRRRFGASPLQYRGGNGQRP